MNRSSIAVSLLLVLHLGTAHAYVDPGSGMLIWQGLIALVGAVIVFLRNPIPALKKLLKRLSGK